MRKMTSTKYIALAVALFGGICGMHLYAQTGGSGIISGRTARDMVIIQDLEKLDISQLFKPASVWVLASINVDPNSNTPDIRMSPGPNPKAVATVFFAGSAKVLSTIHGSFEKKELTFRWDVPFGRRGGNVRRSSTPQASSRLHNGMFALEINPSGEGERQFSTIIEVPDVDWGDYFREAASYCESHGGIFERAEFAKNKQELSALGNGKNPLLVTAALRLLVQEQPADLAIARSALLNLEPFGQALVLAVILENCRPDTVEMDFAAVKKSFASSKRQDEAEALAAAVTFSRRLSGPSRLLGDKVIELVERSLPALQGDSESKNTAAKIVEVYKIDAKH